MSRLLAAVLLLGSVACTTLPAGIEKSPNGVRHTLYNVNFPDTINDHERKDDTYEFKDKFISVRYTHAGYGGIFWIPTVMPSYSPFEGKLNEEKDIRKNFEKYNSTNVVVTGYPFQVGNKKVTIWSGKGEVFLEPNKKVVLIAEKSTQIDYRFIVSGNGFLLEAFGTCSPKEQKYFDSDIKKSFEDFVLANAHLFK